jgi:hypothetical protein
MNPESLILSTLLLINSLGGINNPSKQAQAQFCRDPRSIPADETTRNLELPQFGMTLAIPSNFRAILRNNGTVEVVNPGTYEVLTCVAKGGQALGRGYASITVRSLSNSKNLDLQEFVEQDRALLNHAMKFFLPVDFYPTLALPLERGGNRTGSLPPLQGGTEGGKKS